MHHIGIIILLFLQPTTSWWSKGKSVCCIVESCSTKCSHRFILVCTNPTSKCTNSIDHLCSDTHKHTQDWYGDILMHHLFAYLFDWFKIEGLFQCRQFVHMVMVCPSHEQMFGKHECQSTLGDGQLCVCVCLIVVTRSVQMRIEINLNRFFTLFYYK